MSLPASAHSKVTDEVLKLFAKNGNSQYGREAVSQLEHALQSALLAEKAAASSSLIVAALLHDVGHLLHTLDDDAPDRGIDDRHEELAARWLEARFGPSVVEPVRLHVAAKRYLCAMEPEYQDELSPPSLLSLQLQGGPMSDEEVRGFRGNPHYEAAIRLRRWDDTAKTPNLPTPPLEHFAIHIDRVVREAMPARVSREQSV
jgi:[1-hydroxy-2-(trimethylamino)ethyl]phosphonate dioxygenase